MTLGHLDLLRQNCKNYDLFNLRSIQHALQTVRSLCTDFQVFIVEKLCLYQGGTIWLFITLFPKFIITFSYSLAYELWGFKFDFYLLVHYIECPNVLTTNSNLQ